MFFYSSFSVPRLFSHSFWLVRSVECKLLMMVFPVGILLVRFCALSMVGVRRGRIQVAVTDFSSLREHLYGGVLK